MRSAVLGGVDQLDAELACASVDASLRHCFAAARPISGLADDHRLDDCGWAGRAGEPLLGGLWGTPTA